MRQENQIYKAKLRKTIIQSEKTQYIYLTNQIYKIN